MLVCSRCQKTWEFAGQGHLCPNCRTPAVLPQAEAAELFRAAAALEQDKKHADAFTQYYLLAEAGYPDGEVSCARCYECGLGVPRDLSRAADGYLSAAEHASDRAALRLGILLAKRPRLCGERGSAAFWLRAAAALGNVDAALMLSDEGARLGLSDAERTVYLDAAARGGSPAAIRRIVWAYLRGKGVARDPAAALWFLETLPHPSPIGRLFIRLFYKNPEKREPTPPTMGAPAARLFSLGEEAAGQGFSVTALRLYLLAADGGSNEAALRAAGALLRGVGAMRDPDAAVRLYAAAEGRGSAEAGLALGRIYEEERRDPAAAEAHYLAAAEHGMAEHWYILCDYYIRNDKAGEGIRAAMPWLRRAAEGGCRPAAERLAGINARLYETYNRAVAEQEAGNVREAFHLFESAAALGHADALSNLGYCLQKGLGCTADRRAAARAYRDAVEAGSEAARINLAVCYMNGLGVARDYARATALLEGAAKPYREAARRLLLTMEEARRGKRAHRVYAASSAVYHRGDVDGALRLRLEAAKQGSARACYVIGCHFEFGDGVALDRTRAAQWYERAATGGFSGGHARLKGGYLREKRRLASQ